MNSKIGDIKYFAEIEWAQRAAEYVHSRVNSVLQNFGSCSIMLTGGRSAKKLYGHWRTLPVSSWEARVQFYFTDERCVPETDEESNYYLASRALLSRWSAFRFEVNKMYAGGSIMDSVARYDALLPDSVDIVILGLGDDGHVASLFPGNEIETDRKAVYAKAPYAPFDRISVAPAVITNAKNIFVLAPGESKGLVVQWLHSEDIRARDMPSKLAFGATWFVDTPFLSNV